MPFFRRGVAGHTIAGRSFTHNTLRRRDPPAGKGPDHPSNSNNSNNGNGKKKGQIAQTDTAANTPPATQVTPPANPPPTVSPPSGSAPSNVAPAQVPPAVVPNFGSADGLVGGNSGDSATASSTAVPSASTVRNVASTSPSAPAVVANAGGVPTVTQDSLSPTSGGSNTLDAGDSSQTSTTDYNTDATSATASEKHISGGAIATIVLLLLALFLALVIFIIRRRSRARRIEQAATWWFAGKRTSQTYGDRNSADILPSPRSARSSFATTLDHSVHAFPGIPHLPPMAEVGRVNASSRYHSEGPDNRFSLGSNHSDNSQFLFVDLRSSTEDHTSATAGHSPSDSFAFPKPPSPTADPHSPYSRPSSINGTCGAPMNRANGEGGIHYPVYGSTSPTPVAAPLIGEDPFASNPFRDNNPFEDPKPPVPPTILTTAFAEEETNHRPFQHTVQGDVTVNTMDCVRESGPTFVAARHVSSYGDEGTFSAI